MTEDETVRLYHQLNEHEFEQTLGYSGGQRSLTCFSPCDSKESDTSQGLNNSNNNILRLKFMLFNS